MQATETSVWQDFAAPFAESEISSGRDAAGRGYRYISAAVCRARLNKVLGPDGWQSAVSYHGDTAVVHLTIIDRSGDPIKRGAIGHDEPDRPADDVAFSRCCELFGIGAYLAVGEDRYARRSAAAATPSIAPPAPAPREERPAPPPPRDDRDDYRDERPPAREERPARRDDYDDRDRDRDRDRGGYQGGGSGGYPRSNGSRGSRGPRQGGGWGNGPRPGKSAFRWLMEQEENHRNGRGLADHVTRWLKQQGLNGKISELDQHELYQVVDVVNEYLEGAPAGR